MKALELQKILRRLGITQAEFSRELHVSEASVSRWLRAEQAISPAMEIHIRRTAQEILDKGAAA